MPDPPPPTPGDPGPPPDPPPQPLLEGLDARRLVAGMLEDTEPWPIESDWEAPSPEELGELLVGYQVHRMLGRGGMGAVYLATETRLGREVAIKLLPPELGYRQEFRQRFEREAWILAQLDHPHIVRLHGMGESEGGHLYLVMEYVEGTNLAGLLHDARAGASATGPVLPWPRVVQITSELCEALAHAHARGLIHRDLKPANVLLTPGGSVKLADFGLARPFQPQATGREARAQMTQTGQVMGTYDYMAPEQRDGAPGDHRVDLYGLGVLMYQMLTGALPRGAFSPPSALVGTGPAVDRLVLRALASDPEQRTPSAEALRTELLACPPDGRRAWRDRPYGLAAAAVLAAGVAAAVLRPAPVPTGGRHAPSPGLTAGTPAKPATVPAAVPREIRESFLGHRLRALPGFPGVWVAEAETTVAQYRRFAEATRRPATPAQWAHRVGDPLSEILTWESPGRSVTETEPVVAVSGYDAHDFCHWMTRSARAAGELEPGQEYRLPTDDEWRQAHAHADPEAPGRPGARLEEWLNEPFEFHRPWQAVRPPGADLAHGSPVSATQNAGHTERGFRIVLDLKSAGLRPLSARLWKAAEAWGGGDDGRPPVGVLVTADVVRIDLTRRPEIASLEPLRGLGLTEFRAAPAAPLDLSPLAGHPLTTVFLGGPVVSLEPLARCPLTRLGVGAFDPGPPSQRQPPPSLVPLLIQPRLAHLAWSGQRGGPDVPLRKFPVLSRVSVWDCELESLAFLYGSPLAELTLDGTETDLRANRHQLGRVRRIGLSEPLLAAADRQALAGDLEGALATLAALAADLSEMPWFVPDWQAALDRRRQWWTEWQDLKLDAWLRDGAQGPPPGSVSWRGRSFYYLRTALSRPEAESLAAAWGAQLATLADPEEEAFVRASVVPTPALGDDPAAPELVYAHLGAWRPAAAAPLRWVTGEPWTAGAPREHRTLAPGSFLVLKAGEDRWFVESRRQRPLPTLLEWGTPEETAARRALEDALLGTWIQEGRDPLELKPRGAVGPRDAPGDCWFVVDAAAGRALLSRARGWHRVLLATTADPDRLALTRPDGTTSTLVRRR